MESAALLEELVALADAVGLRVERLSSRAPGEDLSPAVSGRCRLRGETWVLLAPADPIERRIEALAAALRDLAAPELESRYLPPALRAVLFPEG